MLRYIWLLIFDYFFEGERMMSDRYLIPILVPIAALIFVAAGYEMGTHNLGYFWIGLLIIVGFGILWGTFPPTDNSSH